MFANGFEFVPGNRTRVSIVGDGETADLAAARKLMFQIRFHNLYAFARTLLSAGDGFPFRETRHQLLVRIRETQETQDNPHHPDERLQPGF